MPEGQSTERATALLALWNDVDPAHIEAYEAWHAQEHVPERCTVPGILWGRRYGWIAGGAMPRYLTLYGLREPQVLDSEPYRRLLREPTPMSRRMRPALQNVSRWVCRLHEDRLAADAADLAVWTLADGADGDVPGHRLRAERILDAAPLPWLGRDQGLGIEGRWLCAAGTDAAAPGAAIYTRLPVGAA